MKSTTEREDRDFANKVIDDGVADDIIQDIRAILARDSSWVLEWVVTNFDPEDVYDDDALGAWAGKYGYRKLPQERIIDNKIELGGLEFINIPAGKFLMGSKDDNNLAYDAEKPQHTVEIPYDYWIARYEVTNDQFAKFVEAAKYKFDQGKWQDKSDHPVVNVTWHDAMAYSKWLNETLRAELGDQVVRLPTEAEWEKAARGEYGNEWPWGNEFDPKKCNSSEGGKQGTTPVNAYSPQGDSPYGVSDMVGNVWEWTYSLRKSYPYKVDDGRESETDSGVRVVRGGSWFNGASVARCTCRNRDTPVLRNFGLGFRCVLRLL